MKKHIRKQSISVVLIVAALLSRAYFPIEIHAEEYGPFASECEVVSIDGFDAYHLANEAICGASPCVGDYMDFEGFGGLKVKTDGTTIAYTEYGHNEYYSDGYVSIGRAGGGNKTVDLGEIQADETKTADIKKIINELGIDDTPGVFVITLMSGKNHDKPVRMNLYYDGATVQTCRINGTYNNIDKWNRVIGNLDPAKCLDMFAGNKNYPITYPTSGRDNDCNHVQQWCDLSDEIIKFDTWSDEAKVFAMVLWLTRNCAYDNYRVIKNNNKSRATLAGRWNDDNLWMFYNHVGQCWDFANALTIMCRHQGIPCTSVENDYHTVNAVWLDNEWVAIDVSVLVEHECNTEDTDPEKWDTNHRYRYMYQQEYGYYDGSMNTYNQALATPGTTLVGGKGNPM